MENKGQLPCCPLVNINNMCEYEFLLFRWRPRDNFSIVHWYIWTMKLLCVSIWISTFRWRSRKNFSIAHWYIWTIELLYESIRISDFRWRTCKWQLPCYPLVHSAVVWVNMNFYFSDGDRGTISVFSTGTYEQ